jgi:DNA-binding CsgD family transcriptional regulator
MVWLINRRFERSKQKERKKHEKELRVKEQEYEQQSLLAEKEIIRLKNEKLETEKLSLDKELANQTLSIVNKNKFLSRINQEIKRVSDETSDGLVKSRMAVLKKRIDKEIDNQHQKKIFESYFEEVHAGFFERLKEKFPQLSPKDLTLCAYIRMNMSTKEIATLLNISDRGVEISRYRLRKKLGITREVNLSTFLLNI